MLKFHIHSSLLLISLLHLLSLPAFSQQVPPWDLLDEEDGIEVFTRITEDSPVKEIRITVTISSTIARAEYLLSKVPLYPQWVYKCDSSKLIKQVSKNEFYYYVSTDFPFPFADRDLVVHSKQHVDPITGAYHSRSTSGGQLLKVNDDIVRITDFESSWTIKPIHGGLLFIDYQAKSSPGGEIPVWLVNLAITKGPLETMKAFVKMAEDPSFKIN